MGMVRLIGMLNMLNVYPNSVQHKCTFSSLPWVCLPCYLRTPHVYNDQFMLNPYEEFAVNGPKRWILGLNIKEIIMVEQLI